MTIPRKEERQRYQAQGALQQGGQTVQPSVEVEIREGGSVLTARSFGGTSTVKSFDWWEGTLTLPAPVYLEPGDYTLVLTDGRTGEIFVKDGGLGDHFAFSGRGDPPKLP